MITKCTVWNSGAFYLQPRGILIITVQAPTELKPLYTYDHSTSSDLPLGLISLGVDHKINHKYPNLLNKPKLNTVHSRVYISKSVIFGMLKPVQIENAKISETLWTEIDNLNKNTKKNLQELCHCSQNNNDLPTILPLSSFQHEPSNCKRQSVILEDAQVTQEA